MMWTCQIPPAEPTINSTFFLSSIPMTIEKLESELEKKIYVFSHLVNLGYIYSVHYECKIELGLLYVMLQLLN